MEKDNFFLFFQTPLEIIFSVTESEDIDGALNEVVRDGKSHPLGWLYLSYPGMPPVFGVLAFHPGSQVVLGYRIEWLARLLRRHGQEDDQ